MLNYYNLSFSINEVVHLIKDSEIELDTNSNRMFIWSKKKQSLFIDSLYRNFPTPNIFLYTDNSGVRYKVIDGIQRLQTIYAFINNELTIYLKESTLHGKKFIDLDLYEQRKLMRSILNITVLENMENDNEVIKEIFYRLNMGGTSLNNQELRNRMYDGIMIDVINEVNRNNAQWRSFYKKPIDKRYRDSEEILKFFTLVFQEGRNDLSSLLLLRDDMDNFIKNNKDDIKLANHLATVFEKTLSVIFNEFDYNIMKLDLRKGFNSKIYMLLFIPLGILIYRGDNYNFDAFRNIEKIDFNRKLSGKRLVLMGLELLQGDKND